MILVGNKTDMRPTLQQQGMQCVRAEEGYQISQQYGVMFIEASCKDGNNVYAAVAQLTRVMTQNEDSFIQNAGLNLTDTKSKRFACCNK